jgi:hypothetical protein
VEKISKTLKKEVLPKKFSFSNLDREKEKTLEAHSEKQILLNKPPELKPQ